MPSPFPGMDPFIEGQAWEDFHQGFIGELSAALVPLVRPRYVVRKERRIYVEHDLGGEDRLLRADVAVMTETRKTDWQAVQRRETSPADQSASRASAASPVTVHLPMPEQRREPFRTVRDRRTMEVVTVVDLLAPANKRAGSDGRRECLARREEILQGNIHLTEVDLLRGGERLPTVEPLPPADLYAFVCRNHPRDQAEVYPCTLRAPLPRIPIPLSGDDPDVLIDLQQVFITTYDRAGYDYSLNYTLPIHPPLEEPDAAWAAEIVVRRHSGRHNKR
jgi:hypothetical protein